MAEAKALKSLAGKLKVHWKDLVIFVESFILFSLLFDHWDEVKAWIAAFFC